MKGLAMSCPVNGGSDKPRHLKRWPITLTRECAMNSVLKLFGMKKPAWTIDTERLPDFGLSGFEMKLLGGLLIAEIIIVAVLIL